MPMVDGKKFAYTKEGMKAARKAKMSKKKKKKSNSMTRSGNTYE